MTLRFASPTNVYLPRETGLVEGYIRKPEEFKLNQYITYMKTDTMVNSYARIGRDQGIRFKSADEFVWHDGDQRPSGEAGLKIPFEWVEFRCTRRDVAWQIGHQTLEQSATGFDLRAQHASHAAMLLMTMRTHRVLKMLETESNWTSVNHVKTAAQLSGNAGADSLWKNASSDSKSPAYLSIWKSISEAARLVMLDTNASVKMKDLLLIVSPALALEMAQSDEISNYVREQAGSEKIMRDGFDDYDTYLGLPSRYRGIKIVVEETPEVFGENPTMPETNSTNRLYAKSSESAVLVARPGGLDGVPGSKSFSTAQIFHYKGLMGVEAFDDPKHKRLEGHTFESTAEELVAPVSGFLIQGTR